MSQNLKMWSMYAGDILSPKGDFTSSNIVLPTAANNKHGGGYVHVYTSYSVCVAYFTDISFPWHY